MEFLTIALLIMSAVIHEVMHGFVALKLGDPTAKLSGRLTLNPIVHLDLFGSIILPVVLTLANLPGLAWAKPVPINPQYFKNKGRDTLIVALAGPFSNLAIALIFLTALKLILLLGGSSDTFATGIFARIILVNVSLAVFNLIPIPPLDGSKIYNFLFPHNYALIAQIERMGFFLLFIVIYLFGGVLNYLIFFVLNGLLNIFGIPYL